MELLEAEKLMKNLNATVKRYSRYYISPLLLRKIYKDYCKWRHVIKNISGWWLSKRNERIIHEFDSSMVTYLLIRCYFIRYEDNKIVSYLLTVLLELDGDVRKIFDYSLFYTNRRHWDDNWYVGTSLRHLRHDNVSPIEYFFEHAYKSTALYNSNPLTEVIITCIVKDPISNPIVFYLPTSTLLFKWPELLPMLLTYGLFLTASPSDESVCEFLKNIIKVHKSTNFEAIPSKIQEIGNMFLRSIKSVDSTKLLSLSYLNSPRLEEHVLENLIASDAFPKLGERCQKGPQELRHLCRWTIRKRLYENSQLPNGICLLPLPTLVKDYINLKLD